MCKLRLYLDLYIDIYLFVDVVVLFVNSGLQQFFQFEFGVDFFKGVKFGDFDFEVFLVGFVGEGLFLEIFDLVQYSFQDVLDFVFFRCGVQDQRVLKVEISGI